MTRQPDPGPFRWFWANRVTKPCPDCGHRTSVGFDRADPEASAREPTRCVHCATAEVDNAIQFSRGELGYPLTQQGPCVCCGAAIRRYGPHGSPKCGACAQPEAALGPSPESEPSLAGQAPLRPARALSLTRRKGVMDDNGRYRIPAAPHERRFELDCSCGYGLDAPERVFNYMTERHAAAHNKGIDSLPAAATWDIRHIAADQPEPEPAREAEI